MADVYPANFLLLNDQSSKNLNIVVQIDGVPFYISSGVVGTKFRYGDPGFHYGDVGLVYGSLLPRSDVKQLLNLDGSMQIGQKIEPDAGRGAITLLNLSFTDKDGVISQIITPGAIINEPLGNKFVKVYLGFQNSSFPEDYLVILRGYISGTTYAMGKVDIQIADPNLKRKGQICITSKTTLTAPINNSTTTIPVVSTDGFYEQITNALGSYDSAVTTYIKIDNEFIQYGPGGLTPTSFTGVTRGARSGSPAASHDTGATVDNVIQIQENALIMALKFMLSGWGGPFDSGITIRAIGDSQDPIKGLVANSILLNQIDDANQTYGLTEGDFVTISGSTAGNNGTYTILTTEEASGLSGRLIVTDGPLNLESPATGVTVAFRSQYDTFPVIAGSKMRPIEVDVSGTITLKDQFFSQNENRMRFLLFDPFGLKQFCETELFLPLGAYSITRYGQLAVAATKPPIADQKLIVLSKTNVIDAANTTVTRNLNDRRYFSEFDYSLDLSDDNTTYQDNFNFIDANSLSDITIDSILPIQSKGLRSDLGAQTSLIPRRALFLARRYNRVAHQIQIKTDFKTVSQLEAGDVVNVSDNGGLNILNFDTGERFIGDQLYEVIDRRVDLKTGNGQLTLLSNIGVQVTDRFATISPSSFVGVGSTTTGIVITESFGEFYPLNEQNKWVPSIGNKIYVHNTAYSLISNEVTLLGVDPSNNHILQVSPALSFAPSAGMIVEIAYYPATDTDPNTDKFDKLVYAHLDPSITIVSGIDAFNFTVSIPNASVFQIGLPVLIHNTSYSILSPESNVTAIDTGTGKITVETSLGFTPAAGQKAELIGFADGGGPYRII